MIFDLFLFQNDGSKGAIKKNFLKKTKSMRQKVKKMKASYTNEDKEETPNWQSER